MSVKHALLALLAERPTHGHALRQRFEARTGATWPLNIGQVYTTLARAQRDGLVEAGEALPDHSVPYRLTDAGRAQVRAWFDGPVDPDVPARDELAIKVAMALTGGADGEAPDVARLLGVQREHTLRRAQQYAWLRSSLPDRPTAEDLAWELVLDRLELAAQAEVAWLDRATSRLSAVPVAAARAVVPAPRAPADSPAETYA